MPGGFCFIATCAVQHQKRCTRVRRVAVPAAAAFRVGRRWNLERYLRPISPVVHHRFTIDGVASNIDPGNPTVIFDADAMPNLLTLR